MAALKGMSLKFDEIIETGAKRMHFSENEKTLIKNMMFEAVMAVLEDMKVEPVAKKVED